MQTLDQQGKLHFISTIGDHLQFTGLLMAIQFSALTPLVDIWFIDNIVTPFLNGNSTVSLL